MNPDSDFVILPYHEVFYIENLLFSTDSALSSVSWVSGLLKKIEAGQKDFDPKQPLNQLQNLINQGGAISRFFWPSDRKYERRGALLREIFEISEGSPLRNRALRNQVEHYDEYLDDYLKSVSAGVFTPHYFGPEPRNDGVPRHYFKAYYFDTGMFEVLGRRYEIKPLAEEILKLHSRLLESEGHGRFRTPTSETEDQSDI
jgi:hypothetical protein